MGYALPSSGTRSGSYKLLKYLLFLAVLLLPLLLLLPDADGWSSYSFLDRSKTPFGTHERFNYMAYDRLGRHPLLDPVAVNSRGQRIVDFPSLDEIQNYSYIWLKGTGPGPDDEENSYFREHYYNPITDAGGAPEAVKEHFASLRSSLQNPYLINTQGKVPHPTAKHAAYGAHYIQDMTCQFHVLGLPRSELAKWEKQQPGKEILGPFGVFISDRWKKVYLFASTHAKGKKTDWLELNYYDGFHVREFALPFFRESTRFIKDTTTFSTHFFYEGEIEAVCLSDSLCRDEKKWAKEWEQKEGWINPHWKGTDGIEAFTKSLAMETRQRLDAKDSPLAFNRNHVVMNIPYGQWWRAVQATWTLWRGSFSSLFVDLDDLELRKVPNEPEIYNLWVRMHNYEKASAENVGIKFGIEGNKRAAGSITLGTVGKWTIKSGPRHATHTFTGTKIRIRDPRDPAEMKGILRIELSGKYKDIPDPGAVFEYRLRDIEHDAVEMIRLEGYHQTMDQVWEQLKKIGIKRENIKLSGLPSPGEKVRIVSQNPRAGSWISTDDTINLVLKEDGDVPPVPVEGDCSDLREEYIGKFAEMVDRYRERSCEKANYRSGCAQNVAGFIGAHVSGAFADKYCGVPGYIECGKDYLDEYYSCLTDCNEGWLIEIRSQGALRKCQGACNDAAGAAKRACVDVPPSLPDRCGDLAQALNMASEADDIRRFRSLLSRAEDCDFYQQALADLRDWEYEPLCEDMVDELNLAMDADDIDIYADILEQAQDCEFYEEGLEKLHQWEQDLAFEAFCAEVEDDLVYAHNTGDIDLFESALRDAKGCAFYDRARSLLRRWKEDERGDTRCDRLFDDFERSFYNRDRDRCWAILGLSKDCYFYQQALDLLEGRSGGGSKRGRCDEMKKQGSDQPETHIVELGTNSGTFEFRYETFNKKDRIILYQDGYPLFDTRCVGTNGWRSELIPFSGSSSSVTVQVDPNCAGETDTKWEFIVHCP